MTTEEKPKPHGSHEMGADGAPCQVCWVWADDEGISDECCGPVSVSESTRSKKSWLRVNKGDAGMGSSGSNRDTTQSRAEACAALDLLAAVHGWSLADVQVLTRAALLGSPTRIAAGSSREGKYDTGDKCSGSGQVRAYTPPVGGAEVDAGRLYRALGGPR